MRIEFFLPNSIESGGMDLGGLPRRGPNTAKLDCAGAPRPIDSPLARECRREQACRSFTVVPARRGHGPDVGNPSKDIAGDLAFLGYVSLVLVENGVNSFLYAVIGFGTAANGLWTRNQPKLNETLICRLWRECVSPTMPDGCSDTSLTYEFAKINQNL